MTQNLKQPECRIILTSTVDTDSGQSGEGGLDLTADSLVQRSKQE